MLGGLKHTDDWYILKRSITELSALGSVMLQVNRQLLKHILQQCPFSPKVTAMIDCTHVKLRAPKDDELVFCD